MTSLLLRPLLPRPPLRIERACTAPYPPLARWKKSYTTGKAVEFSSELFISRFLSTIRSDENASIVLFDDCPYSSHISRDAKDPFAAARKTVDGLAPAIAPLVLSGKGCVVLALHPFSYPSQRSVTRHCTVLVEDRTLSGDERDIVVPAAALNYGPAEKEATEKSRQSRRCLLTYVGNTNRVLSAEFQNLRGRVRAAMLRLAARNKDACVAAGDSESYVRAFANSRFCFVLPGDTNGGEKLALSIAQRCVPVIEHHSWRSQPFFSLLNYSAFAVRMPLVAEDVEELLLTLRALSWAQYDRYFRNVRLASEWFDYARHDHQRVSPYALIFHELAEIWS